MSLIDVSAYSSRDMKINVKDVKLFDDPAWYEKALTNTHSHNSESPPTITFIIENSVFLFLCSWILKVEG